MLDFIFSIPRDAVDGRGAQDAAVPAEGVGGLGLGLGGVGAGAEGVPAS
jgi:hypothetical protein